MPKVVTTKEDAREALLQAGASISAAVAILAPHMPLFDQFEAEERDMENFGHIIDPTLYRSSERRAAAALMSPIFKAARAFVNALETQSANAREALEKVRA
ncbi:hypothetical protein sos41_11660 [Alphaproteobacteria bacterium SO-S41]|nr:hypothetical protein sos41_11660 [Alphaproteobacteria bacterium SO-S41]